MKIGYTSSYSVNEYIVHFSEKHLNVSLKHYFYENVNIFISRYFYSSVLRARVDNGVTSMQSTTDVT